VGRKDDRVKIHGGFISLTQLEELLQQLPSVQDIAVVPRENPDSRKLLTAFYVAEEKVPFGILQHALQEWMPERVLPVHWRQIDALPLTVNNKLDRKMLERIAVDETFGEIAGTAAAPAETESEHERRMAEIWSAALGRDKVGRDENFFEAGGDSLAVIGLLTEVSRVFGREIPFSVLLDAPTVAQFCTYLDSVDRPISLFALGPSRKRPSQQRPLFCVFGFYLYKVLAEHLGSEVATYGIYIDEETMDGGLQGSEAGSPDVRDFARRYIAEIRRLQPHGPYRLLGSSFGGLVAYEMAQQLRASGEPVEFIGMIDTLTPSSRRIVSVRALPFLIRRAILRAIPIGLRQRFRSIPVAAVHVHLMAMTRYEIRPYDGDVVLFRAGEPIESPGFEFDQSYGWDHFVRGQLDVHVVPGSHIGVLAEPNVAKLAQLLAPYLEHD